MKARLLIVAYGNPWAGDDGVGQVIARGLRRARLGKQVRVRHDFSDASNLAVHWRGERRIWLLDAVDWGAAPGAIRVFREEEVLALPQRHESAHRLSLPECLRWLRLSCPEMDRARIRLLGVQPAEIEFGAPLSPAVRRTARRISRSLTRRLTQEGASSPRPPASQVGPQIWPGSAET
ncbi:MAG: hydrogenase maturation protease [Candidatus Eisenbacteria bacterium]|nr:hydrogenase maturation protease [Candidatus Eisenbacteria bacterium]MCC7144448.1 hydrogenase maturation protease [Candidatus Eisenbacteria bacterium]